MRMKSLEKAVAASESIISDIELNSDFIYSHGHDAMEYLRKHAQHEMAYLIFETFKDNITDQEAAWLQESFL